MAKAALTCRRVRHMTDGLSPLFVMPNEFALCLCKKHLFETYREKLQEVQE